jgi:hypothetical protein
MSKFLLRPTFLVAFIWSVFTLVSADYALAQDTNILFVGNSYTHGRYQPVLGYNAGAANNPSDTVVHDLLCPSLPCSMPAGSGLPVEGGMQITPTASNTPTSNGATNYGTGLVGQLNYLQANSSSQYNEVGPYGGVAGIFLQFTKEAGLHYNVSLIAVSSATLQGYVTGTSKSALPLIANSTYSQVVLQEQSFKPLPTTISVNGQTVGTRGAPGTPTDTYGIISSSCPSPCTNANTFGSGVRGLVTSIDNADAAAGKANAAITLYQTPPLASYGYTSSSTLGPGTNNNNSKSANNNTSNNPNAPIFGTSTPAQQTGTTGGFSNTTVPGPYAPYVGDANPIAAMASDLHNAYVSEANGFNAAYPSLSHLNVALAGDAWVSAINSGLAQLNPFLTNEPAGQINLWDSDPYLACCTVPIGYHPSQYGDFLDALMLFGEITGVNPETLSAEWDTNNPLYSSSASLALGIDPQIADELAIVAEDTLLANGPVATPLPSTWSMMLLGLAGIAFLSHWRSRRSRTPRGIIPLGHAA